MSESFTEGAALIGAARTAALSFPVRIERIGSTGTFKVVSTPYPLHWATVVRSRVTPSWFVIVETADHIPVKRFGKRDLIPALHHAGVTVSALYRVDWRRRFTGAQRYVMGRNLCPGRVPCDLGADCPRVNIREHYHLCKGVPEGPNTVWCVEHTETPESPGDAFYGLGDTQGGG